MMIGLNKLGVTLTVILAVTLTALAVEIIYLLWRRRQRYRPRGRIEPQEASLSCSSSSPRERERELELDLELELELEHQVMKFRHVYGPSRVLFTINEEEREGLESENGGSASEDCGDVMVVRKVVDDRNEGQGDWNGSELNPFGVALLLKLKWSRQPPPPLQLPTTAAPLIPATVFSRSSQFPLLSSFPLLSISSLPSLSFSLLSSFLLPPFSLPSPSLSSPQPPPRSSTTLTRRSQVT
ncbi:hypothetical protein RIF29_20767 [Crotalaria pallida]|uniref:Uncharacterized protein n=1 Tax=Crotalaria pallida TaxID=3830 RepID=A0AAN9F5C1_CROPI